MSVLNYNIIISLAPPTECIYVYFIFLILNFHD